jgi:ribosomal protein S18 acetylase RimI-like enzyme
LRDETLAIVAGLSAWTWGNSLEVLTLWVREDWRGKGHGARLLAAAEAEALARGCRQVHLNTFAFQAPGFYERHGYTVFGVLENYLDGQHRYYLKKALA